MKILWDLRNPMTNENKEMDERSIGGKFNQTSARNENSFHVTNAIQIIEKIQSRNGFIFVLGKFLKPREVFDIILHQFY